MISFKEACLSLKGKKVTVFTTGSIPFGGILENIEEGFIKLKDDYRYPGGRVFPATYVAFDKITAITEQQ